MWMLIIVQIFSSADHIKSFGAAITHISTCFRGSKQSYAWRFISSLPILFLLPVTGFLILSINYTKAELVVELRVRLEGAALV